MASRYILLLLGLLALHTQILFAGEIHEAVSMGDCNRLQEIISTNLAAVNERDGDGNTPLHNAARAGDTNAIRILLTAKANIAVTNRAGFTPIRLAKGFGHIAAADLLTPGLNPDSKPSRPKMTTLTLNGTTWTNISEVRLLSDRRIACQHDAGTFVAKFEEFPSDFLNTWGITQSQIQALQNAALEKEKATKELRAKAVATRTELIKGFTNSITGFADYKPLRAALGGVVEKFENQELPWFDGDFSVAAEMESFLPISASTGYTRDFTTITVVGLSTRAIQLKMLVRLYQGDTRNNQKIESFLQTLAKVESLLPSAKLPLNDWVRQELRVASTTGGRRHVVSNKFGSFTGTVQYGMGERGDTEYLSVQVFDNVMYQHVMQPDELFALQRKLGLKPVRNYLDPSSLSPGSTR